MPQGERIPSLAASRLLRVYEIVTETGTLKVNIVRAQSGAVLQEEKLEPGQAAKAR